MSLKIHSFFSIFKLFYTYLILCLTCLYLTNHNNDMITFSNLIYLLSNIIFQNYQFDIGMLYKFFLVVS